MATYDGPELISALPMIGGVLFFVVGVFVLLSAFRPAMRDAIRVRPSHNSLLARIAVSVWCLAVATVLLGRGLRWSFVTTHVNMLNIIGFGSLILGGADGYFVSRRA